MCYEVFSYGKTPYHGCTNEDVLDEVPVGRRLPQPVACPDAVYILMLRMWAHNDHERPGALSLAHALAHIRDRLAKGAEDADLVCSQATAVTRAHGRAQLVYHDEALERLSPKMQARKRRLTQHLLLERDSRSKRKSTIASDAAPVVAASRILQDAAADHVLRRVSEKSDLSVSSEAESADLNDDYMLVEGGVDLADHCIVLEPEGVDADTEPFDYSTPQRKAPLSLFLTVGGNTNDDTNVSDYCSDVSSTRGSLSGSASELDDFASTPPRVRRARGSHNASAGSGRGLGASPLSSAVATSPSEIRRGKSKKKRTGGHRRTQTSTFVPHGEGDNADAYYVEAALSPRPGQCATYEVLM